MQERFKKFIKSNKLSNLLLAVTIFFAVAIVGSFTRIPILSLGTFMTNNSIRLSVTIGLIMLITIAFYFAEKSGKRLSAVVLSLISFFGVLVISATMIRTAQAEGVNIDYRELFSLSKEDYAPDVEITDYLTYDGKDYTLSIWKSANSEELSPIIVYIHGGGWSGGTRLEKKNLASAKYFSEAGYLTISIDYPLSDKEHAYWNEQELAASRAILWVKEHALEYGGDIKNLFIAGDSAGGNLTINIASRINDGTFAALTGEEYPKIKAIAPLYPAPTITGVYADSDIAIRGLLKVITSWHIGGSPLKYTDRADYMDSNKVISSDTPPMLLIYGDKDHVVPHSATMTFLQTLENSDIKHRVIALPFADHVLEAPNTVGAQIYHQLTVEWFNQYLE